MKRILGTAILLLALNATGQTPQRKATTESPKQGATAILELLKERNYSDLFQKRYTEWYKVEDQGVKPDVAIKKLSARWERNHEQTVMIFEELAKADFEVTKKEQFQKTETGDVATAMVLFGDKEIPYTLYKMKNGLWGFHM